MYRARKDIGTGQRYDSCLYRARKDRGKQATQRLVVIVCVFVFVLCMHACTVPGRTSAHAIGAHFQTAEVRRVCRRRGLAGECETRVQREDGKQKRGRV